MTAPSKYEFHDYISRAIAEDITLAAEVHLAMDRGLQKAIMDTRTQACDFESALAMYVRKERNRESYARSMVEKWRGRHFLNWEWWKP